MTAIVSAREFRDDDAGYLTWLESHPDGYVLNIARSHNTAQARVHHAGCRTISGQNPRGGPWTGPYVKVCAEDLAGLEQWAVVHVRQLIQPCGTCHPNRRAAKPTSTVASAVSGRRYEIRGPSPGSAIVEAWADAYIPFDPSPDWQKALSAEIKTRCKQLEPSTGQVLHATFYGDKRPNADIENILLYNIDSSFSVAGRNGIRFEHGAAAPLAPADGEYPFCYRYALAPRSGSFADWQQRRTLASFDWTDLGVFARDKIPAQVWLALARGHAEVIKLSRAPDAPFAVKVEIRPPRELQPRVNSDLVKGIFDGVICAFQAHTDATVLPVVVARLAAILPADPLEIRKHLADQRRAVLGVVPRLVYPYREGVKWDPADHLCVAGELLAAKPVDSRWAIRGEIVELIAPVDRALSVP